MIKYSDIDRSSKIVSSMFKLHNKVFNKTVLERVQGKKGQTFKKRKGYVKTNILGLDVFTKYSEKAVCDIIYLHGGAYVMGLNVTQFMFVNQMSKYIEANIHLIDYPLAPESTVDETVEITKKVIIL